MKIGIDFGSTYSTVARYNPHTDNVEAITPSEGDSASIPSVVSVSNKTGKMSFGSAAKGQSGRKSVRIFEAFKMLLTEKSQEMLTARGYDSEYTPRYIASKYLEYIIETSQNRSGDEPVDSAVICVPEIWCERYSTVDGRPILRDILTNEVKIPPEGIQVVTEPEAASAYFAYNYRRKANRPFNGHLLLIDYGGGTLDITLTEVKSYDNGAMEITYKEGGGAGENHPEAGGSGMIGTAGIAFMQDVVVSAIRDADMEPPESFTDPDFLAAVRDLESQLKSADRIREIDKYFGGFGSYKYMEDVLDETETFASVEYEDEEIFVTYQQLYRSYRKIIDPVLSRTVGEMNEKVKKALNIDPCRPDAGKNGDFLIALVGGFGSFFLVKKQIAEIYNLDIESDIDPRTKNISRENREQAISLGAALIAAEKVKLQKVARFSIGFCLNRDGIIKGIHYGIRYHQIINPGTIYYPLRANGKPVNYVSLYDNIKQFAIEFSDSTDCCLPMYPKSEIRERLRNLPDAEFWNCGFSMDNREVIYLHVNQVPHPGKEKMAEKIKIPLEKFQNMFDMTEAVEKKVGDCIE